MPESQRKQELSLYLEHVLYPSLTVLSYNREAALWHAEERARLSAQGRTPPFIDGQIASIAVINNLILITRNTDDCIHFSGLTIENWFIGPVPE